MSGNLTQSVTMQVAEPRRGGRYLFAALAIVFGCLAGVLLSELLLRAFWPEADRYYLWPPRLTHTFRPPAGEANGVAPTAQIKVNSVGVLGDEFPPEGTPQYRILAVGGSTTQCIMLDQSKSWPTVLQHGLARTADGRQVWVGNLGRAGFNTRDHLATMRLVVDQYKPDAIVMLAGANDLCARLAEGDAYDPRFVEDEARYRDWVLTRMAMRPRSAWSGPFYRRTAVWQLGRWLKSIIVGRDQWRIDEQGASFFMVRNFRQKAVQQDKLPALDTALDEFERNLRGIVEEAHTRSIRLVLMTQPTFWKETLTPAEDRLLGMGWGPPPGGKVVWPWWKNRDAVVYTSRGLKAAMDSYNGRMKRTCAELNVECFDMASRLPQTTTVYFDDMHFTEYGAQQFAEELAAYLKSTVPFAGQAAAR